MRLALEIEKDRDVLQLGLSLSSADLAIVDLAAAAAQCASEPALAPISPDRLLNRSVDSPVERTAQPATSWHIAEPSIPPRPYYPAILLPRLLVPKDHAERLTAA